MTSSRICLRHGKRNGMIFVIFLGGTYCEHVALAPEPRAKVTVDDRLEWTSSHDAHPQTHIVTFLCFFVDAETLLSFSSVFSESHLLFPLLSGSSHQAFKTAVIDLTLQSSTIPLQQLLVATVRHTMSVHRMVHPKKWHVFYRMRPRPGELSNSSTHSSWRCRRNDASTFFSSCAKKVVHVDHTSYPRRIFEANAGDSSARA